MEGLLQDGLTSSSALMLAALCAAACGSSAPTNPSTTGPKILCPAAPVPVPASSNAGLAVTYGAASVSGGAPSVRTSCLPASGSTFPVGSTTVVCTATDAQSRSDSCTFPVVVEPFVPPKIPTIAATTFAAFGDSITWGEDGIPPVVCGPNTNDFAIAPQLVHPYNRVTSPGPYPAVLETSLKGRYVNQSSQIVVDNLGKPGETTYGDGTTPAVSRFRTETSGLSTLGTRYQGVLLMEGTNDIFYGNDDAKIAAAVANLGSMIEDAKSRGIRVFLATIPPMVPGGVRACGNHEVAPLNDGIRALAAQKGVALVDVYASLGASYQQYIGSDGVHPNQAGYVKIASIFFDALTAAFETARRPSRALQ